MLQIRGHAGGTTLTGTLYERGEEPPQFKGAPNEAAPYVWVCDAFYEVESGGQVQRIGGRELNVAFESPMPRGFEDREQALDAAAEHVRTQFARVGLPPEDVEVEVVEADPGDVDDDEPGNLDDVTSTESGTDDRSEAADDEATDDEAADDEATDDEASNDEVADDEVADDESTDDEAAGEETDGEATGQ